MDAFVAKVRALEEKCRGDGVEPARRWGHVVTLLRDARAETLELLAGNAQVQNTIGDLNLGPRSVEGFLDDEISFPHFVRRFLKST